MSSPQAVTWYVNCLRFREDGSAVSLGICGYSNKVAHIAVFDPDKPANAEVLKTMIIRDVFVVPGVDCEDGRYCVNTDCPLNRASISFFRKYGIRSKGELERLHELVEDARAKLNLKSLESGGCFFYERPLLRLTRRGGKK